MNEKEKRQLEEMLNHEYGALAPILADQRHVRLPDAEEAIHAAVFRVVRMLTYRPQDGRAINWKPYILKAANNELNMEARRRKNGLPILHGKENEIALANYCDPAPTSGTRVEEKELAKMAWDEMLKLPEQQCEVLTRRYRDEATFRQIGAAMGIAESTARVHHFEGIAELRKRLWISFCLAEIAWMWKIKKWRQTA